MKITKKLEKEILAVIEDYWDSYLQGDLQTWASYLPDEYKNIGTTKAEIWNSKKEIVEFTERVIDQTVGMAETRNKRTQIIPYDPYVMVHELGDLYVKAEEGWVFYAPFRLSSLLEKTSDGWKILHQHGSYPDSKAEEGEAFAFSELKAENKKLRDAIQARTLELERKNHDLEIEAALERVRAQTMAMHNSEDVGQCILKLFGELTTLGVHESTRLGIGIFNHDNENMELWTASKDEDEGVNLYSGNLDMSAHPLLQSARNSWKEKQRVNQFILEGKKEVLAYFQVINASPAYQPKIKIEGVPDRVIHYDFVFDQGIIYAFCRHPLPEELIGVFRRFSALFEQTYRRYLDLVKAEAQAREAQIEAALERVRARSMAMHKTEELAKVVEVISQQLQELGIDILMVYVGIYIYSLENKYVDQWFSSIEGIKDEPFYIRLPSAPWEDTTIKDWRAGKEMGYLSIQGAQAIMEYAKSVDTMANWNIFERMAKEYSVEILEQTEVNHKYGNLSIVQDRKATETEKALLKRFARVFEQAYTRFLDLQKAEERTWEARIEAALEKVRSRSLAVNRSEEFNEVVGVVFEKLSELDMPVGSVTIGLTKEGTKDLEVYGCGEGESGLSLIKFNLPYFPNAFTDDILAAQSSADSGYFSKVYSEAQKNEYYEFAFKNTELKNLPDDLKERVWQSKSYALSVAFTKNSLIMVNEFEGKVLNNDHASILKRFSSVFEQAYIRFLDLQRAEAQAREAQIEAALERVRSRSMAMHQSEEIQEVANTLFKNLLDLGVSTDTATILVPVKGSKDFEIWIQNIDSNYSKKVLMPYQDHPITKDFLKAAQNQLGIFTANYSKEKKDSFFQFFFSHPEALANIPEERKRYVLDGEAYAISLSFNTHTGMQIGRYSNTAFSEADNNILQRFAKVFEQSYTRFLDLQKAEAQAREAEIEAALERVRAQTMAMHNSEDIGKCIVRMFSELTALGVDEGTRFGIGILNHDNENNQLWTASKEGEKVNLHIGQLDMSLHPLLKSARKAWKEQAPLHKYVLEGEDLLNYYQVLNSADDYKYRKAIEKLPEREIHYGFIFDHGFFYAFNSREFQAEIIQMIQRFTSLFGQTYRRYLDLVKAEEQARKAQIEAAVERVRAEAMAMHSSEDFSQVNEALWEQVKKLEVTGFAGAGIALFDQDDHITWWDFSSAGNIGKHEHKVTRYNYKKYPLLGLEIWDAYQTGEPYYIIEYDLPRLKKGAKEWAAINPIIAQEFEKAIASGHLTYQWGAWSRITNGFLTFDHLQPPDEDAKTILLKMAGAFELAYQRFLDLQRAEAQAREAQIEAALERTRTQSMLMQHSDELNKISHVFHEQLLLLGLPSEFSYVWLPDEESMTHMFWATWSENLPAGKVGNKAGVSSRSKAITYPLDKSEPYTAACYEMWGSEQSVFVNRIAPEEVSDFFTSWEELLSEAENMKADLFPEGLYYAEAYMKYGCFGINIRRPLSEEEQQVLYRFSIEFERAYTRFLDLKKAEVRAREAQIEAALEIVRSRTMAMHKAEELHDVVSVVVEKLVHLGVVLDANGVILCTYFEDSRDVLHWIASPDFSFSGSYLLPYFDHPIFRAAWESKLSGDDYFSRSFTVEEKNSFFEYAFEHSDYRHFPKEFKQWVFQNDKHSLSFAWSKHSAILVPSHTGVLPTKEDAEILKRFAKVFEQAYVRFMDLQKAEVQAKEALKRAALDRVRGEIASMRSTEDLNRITPVIWRELTSLDVPFIRCGVFIVNEASKLIEVYLTTPEGKALGVLNLPFDVNSQATNTVKYWRDKKVYREHWDAQAFTEWTQSMIEMGQVKNFADYQGAAEIPKELYLHFVPFKQGMLYVGDVHPLQDEKIELVKTLAEAFSIAYARYEDFVSLEQAKTEVEIALAELKSTQSQLIHAEKMASLGELTAGIAHEIQNPLNFVNNFSEVSEELLDDMKEELENGDLDEVKAIANDLKQNLNKINHHGQRADAIVKGMLQHSRQSTAEKTATDINKLADEYLRLAYHGLRAKDKSFNATLNTHFDPTLGKLMVIPQDIGRVILNLVTNAFYAVQEKKKNNGTYYQPTVSMSTKKAEDQIIISLKDNGDGIPQHVIDKIFQPFFTTKPTGQGTGLGLSLSYDIIKAHEGKLEVETEEGVFTIFRIILPTKK